MSAISRLQLRRPGADAAPVGLDLRLTGTTATDTDAARRPTTGLARQRLTPAAKPRQQVLSSARARPAPCPPCSGRAGRRCRGSAQVRSTTLTLTTSSSWRSWPGVSSPSQITVSAPVATHDVAQLLRLAGADVGRRVGLVAALDEPVEHLRAGGLGEQRSSAREFSASRSVPSVQTPTSTTRSSRSCRYSTSVTSWSSVDKPATRRRACRSSRSN